jgi:hypothetical protein
LNLTITLLKKFFFSLHFPAFFQQWLFFIPSSKRHPIQTNEENESCRQMLDLQT